MVPVASEPAAPPPKPKEEGVDESLVVDPDAVGGPPVPFEPNCVLEAEKLAAPEDAAEPKVGACVPALLSW